MKNNKKRWSVAGFVDWREYLMDELENIFGKNVRARK